MCTRPLDGVTAEDLQAGIAERLPWLAQIFRSKGLKATLERLAVKQQAPLVWEIHYRADPEHSIDAERYTDPASVKEEVGELLEFIEDCEEDGVERVRACLAGAVETVGIELKLSDAQSIGWAVAIGAGAYLAARGEGLVQADEAGWMAPDGTEVEQIIDSD